MRPLLTACALVTFVVSSSACTGAKPSREDCDQFVEHFTELLKKNEDPEGRKVKKLTLKQEERVLELCVSKGTKKEVLCSLEQDTFEAIAENCK